MSEKSRIDVRKLSELIMNRMSSVAYSFRFSSKGEQIRDELDNQGKSETIRELPFYVTIPFFKLKHRNFPTVQGIYAQKDGIYAPQFFFCIADSNRIGTNDERLRDVTKNLVSGIEDYVNYSSPTTGLRLAGINNEATRGLHLIEHETGLLNLGSHHYLPPKDVKDVYMTKVPPKILK